MDINSEQFSVLPPHFGNNQEGILSVNEWEDILPGYSTYYPKQFRVAIPYLLASIVYHQEWLKEKLPNNHPIFLQRIYTSGLLNKLRDNILGNCLFSSEIGMQATGVPPNVVLNYCMCSLERNMTRVEVALNEKVSSIPNKVCEEVMSHFVVNRAVPISASQVTNLITTMQFQVLTEIRNEIRSLGQGNTVVNSVQGRNISDISAQSGEASIVFQF